MKERYKTNEKYNDYEEYYSNKEAYEAYQKDKAKLTKMTYKEYDEALDKLLSVQELLIKVESKTKGERAETAKEGIEIIKKSKAILHILYGAKFDDEN